MAGSYSFSHFLTHSPPAGPCGSLEIEDLIDREVWSYILLLSCVTYTAYTFISSLLTTVPSTALARWLRMLTVPLETPSQVPRPHLGRLIAA